MMKGCWSHIPIVTNVILFWAMCPMAPAQDVKIGQARGMFDSEIDRVLNEHNEYRRKQQASNMEYLYYNKELEAQAITLTKTCVFEHKYNDAIEDKGWSSTGQNLWAGTGKFAEGTGEFNIEGGIGAWYNEISDYNYDSLSCSKVCGHYTQVVWATSKYIGCAYNFCEKLGSMKNAHYLVCNYGPPGNYKGQKPFKKGEGCTGCTSGNSQCDKGLCRHCSEDGGDCVCEAKCHNCGVAPTDGKQCYCECADGWTGASCQDVCENKDTRCGNGWFSDQCDSPDAKYVADKCLAMCGKCKVGTGSTQSCDVNTASIPVNGPPVDNGKGCVSSISGLLILVMLVSAHLAALRF